MSKTYLLYNSNAGHGRVHAAANELACAYNNPFVVDMASSDGYRAVLADVAEDDVIVICGGDGTINRFVNETRNLDLKNKIFYHAVGSGNDFMRDVAPDATAPIELNKYIERLPTVTVNGKEYLFVNGVGYGIDGYCCEEGDRLKALSDKPVNYTAIAIKGLLFKYKPTSAKVRVDGKEYSFKRVWIAPSMNGRFYGGGMMPAPEQNRLDPERKLSLVVLHDSGKLGTLMIFPSIFKGKLGENKSKVTVLTGHEIEVEFDRPVALQIDGETVIGVSSYRAVSAKHAELKV